MSNVPSDRKYAVSHEWARTDADGMVSIGITDHAQKQLGDVVFVELPEIGAHFDAGDAAGVVESVKAASDIYAPVSGTVVEINPVLEGAPETINADPYAEGWFFRIEADDPVELDDLMDAEGYRISIAED